MPNWDVRKAFCSFHRDFFLYLLIFFVKHFFFIFQFCYLDDIFISAHFLLLSVTFVSQKCITLLVFSTWLPQNCLKTLEWLFYVVFVDYLRNSSNIIETFSLKLLTPTRNLIWFLRLYANFLAIRRIWWCKSILFQYEV